MLAPLISVDNKQGDDEAILYMVLNINNPILFRDTFIGKFFSDYRWICSQTENSASYLYTGVQSWNYELGPLNIYPVLPLVIIDAR